MGEITPSYHSKHFAMASDVSANDVPGALRTPDAQLVPDEKVELLLEKVKSPSGETELRKAVEALER